RGMHSVRDLPDDRADLVERETAEALRVLLEDLACGPFDGEEVHSRPCFANLDRANDVRMLHALAVARFAKEARYGGAILAQLFAQYLHGDSPVVGVLRAEDGRRSALADLTLQGVAGDGLSNKVFAWHAANLTFVEGRG